MTSDECSNEVDREFVFYIYEDDEVDPRFSFWLETSDGNGMSLYERPPDGAGMWLKPSAGSDHDSVAPTDELKAVVAKLLDSDVSADAVHSLPPHERYFVQVIHGTINEVSADNIPDPVWGWMWDCADWHVDSEEVAPGGDSA